jgi:hypothetical protein
MLLRFLNDLAQPKIYASPGHLNEDEEPRIRVKTYTIFDVSSTIYMHESHVVTMEEVSDM